MTRKFSPAQMKYMKAKAMHETIVNLEKQCKEKVLEQNDFWSVPVEGIDEKTERILKPGYDFTMSDKDFIEYCKLAREQYQAIGIETPDYNTSPTYKSRPALKKAERELIEWGWLILRSHPKYSAVAAGIENLKKEITHNTEIREKVIDLTLSLVA